MTTRFLLAVLLLLAAAAPVHAQCSRVVVSGYLSDNLHAYDGCSGAFLGLVDGGGRVNGPQASRIGPDGLLWVVSEENARILRYDPRDFTFVDVWVNVGGAFSPTGIAFGPDGDVYVCGYTSDTVRRYDGTTRALEGTVVAPRAAGLNGPDNGMTFGPDGKLYVPGYDSDSVVVWDPATGNTSGFIATGSGGLDRTRGILFQPDGSVLVSSEGNGQILRYGAGGNFLNVFASGLGAPAGMSFLPDGTIVVADNGGNALRISTAGQNLGPLFTGGTGGLDGATFAAVIPAAGGGVDTSQVGTQFWVVGGGTVTGNTLEVELFSATGTVFGANFNAANVVRKRWGTARIVFNGCRTGAFTWTSTGANSAGFGDGGYPLELLVPTRFTTECETAGFPNVQGTDWVNGTWWGGASRSGEGLLVNKASDGTLFMAWFTHRPPAP